jgi:RNA polymerase sigma-70 factor, ECF subfamily
MKTLHMRKLRKRLSRNTGEVRIGTERDFSRRSGRESLLDFSRLNENAERPTDIELMEAVVRRDSDAMTAIYQRYESTLRAVITSVLHEEADTDDVLHDVFIQLWNRADRFVAEKGLRGFLITLAKRRALDRLRRRLAYHRATDRFETLMRTEFNDKMRGPGVKPTNFDLSEILSRMIGLLPEPQQEVVRLTFFKGLSQREIAAQKSIALGTVKTRLYLAQKKLLNRLEPIQNKI